MRKISQILLLIAIIGIAILVKPKNDKDRKMEPTEGIIVKLDAEDVPKKKSREAWIELAHKAADGVDWRAVELENDKRSAKYKQSLRAQIGNRDPRNGEIVAEGNLEGRWLERGSDNQAGNMITLNYFPEEDMLFGLSAGGVLWQGDRTGFNWQVVNQDYTFHTDLVEMRYLPDGQIRYIAGLNNKPVYSDDGGNSWLEAEGIETSGSARMQDFIEDSEGHMYILHKRTNIQFMSVFRSTDNGTSWQRIQEFTGRNQVDFNLVKTGQSEDIYVIEQIDSDESRIHKLNRETSSFDVVVESSPIGFGSSNDRANLNVAQDGDTLRMFVMTPTDDGNNQELFTSVDEGISWQFLSQLPTNPWDVGIVVSPSNPQFMNYGEVNPYRSRNGGKSWSQTSIWWEYYDDVFNSLHADIMDYKEFEDIDGNPFTVVCNHGGVSQSFDYGQNWENIGLISLNIGQFYSVATHPVERNIVFGGTQDQGFQRGRIIGDNIASLDQVISGDYGNIVFSGEENNLWTVFPFGSVSYYSNPLAFGPTTWYDLESENENIWLPPLLAHPDKNQNAIFMAGGSVDGGPGSHMIRLDADQNHNISATQFDYDFLQSGGLIAAMDISTFDHNNIYVGTTSGVFHKSTDGGETFEVKEVGLPTDHWLFGSCIKASKIDPDIIYYAGSGYSNPAVYVSRDGGESFVPMSTGLPPTLVFCIAPNEDESLIYAATEAGPFVYITALDEWFELSGVNTPSQTYWAVEYLPETKTARFATYGRGLWDFSLDQIIISSNENLAATNNVNIFPNPTADYVMISTESEEAFDVKIIDQQGRIIQTINETNSKKLRVDLANQPSGIYFAHINAKSGFSTHKIIKK